MREEKEWCGATCEGEAWVPFIGRGSGTLAGKLRPWRGKPGRLGPKPWAPNHGQGRGKASSDGFQRG